MPVYPAWVCALCNLQTILVCVHLQIIATYNYTSKYLICFWKNFTESETALSSLLNELGDELTTKQHEILQYNSNHVQMWKYANVATNNEAACCWKKFGVSGWWENCYSDVTFTTFSVREGGGVWPPQIGNKADDWLLLRARVVLAIFLQSLLSQDLTQTAKGQQCKLQRRLINYKTRPKRQRYVKTTSGVYPGFFKGSSEWRYECSIRIVVATADCSIRVFQSFKVFQCMFSFC